MGKKNLLEEMQDSINKVLERPVAGPEKARTSRAILDEFRAEATAQSLPPETSLVTETSLVSETSLVTDQPHAYSETRLVSETSLAPETTHPENIVSGIDRGKYGRGYSRLLHDFMDREIRLLPTYEQIIYVWLNRYRVGASNLTVILSLSKISEVTGISQSSVQRSVASLERKGYIKKYRQVQGRERAQGWEYWVFTPDSLVTETSLVPKTSLVSVGTIKEKHLKENNKRVLANAKDCPDCNGTGFTYPDGFERGAKKCTHPKLRT